MSTFTVLEYSPGLDTNINLRQTIQDDHDDTKRPAPPLSEVGQFPGLSRPLVVEWPNAL